jgi:hypothetical protein
MNSGVEQKQGRLVLFGHSYLQHIRNWTALFCTGSRFPVPPALAGESVYIFPNSTGYDGQMYHYVAHDPFIRTDMWRYMDNAQVRYRRILLPALAFLLAAGWQPGIDRAYIGANLLFLFFGCVVAEPVP